MYQFRFTPSLWWFPHLCPCVLYTLGITFSQGVLLGLFERHVSPSDRTSMIGTLLYPTVTSLSQFTFLLSTSNRPTLWLRPFERTSPLTEIQLKTSYTPSYTSLYRVSPRLLILFTRYLPSINSVYCVTDVLSKSGVIYHIQMESLEGLWWSKELINEDKQKEEEEGKEETKEFLEEKETE